MHYSIDILNFIFKIPKISGKVPRCRYSYKVPFSQWSIPKVEESPWHTGKHKQTKNKLLTKRTFTNFYNQNYLHNRFLIKQEKIILKRVFLNRLKYTHFFVILMKMKTICFWCLLANHRKQEWICSIKTWVE